MWGDGERCMGCESDACVQEFILEAGDALCRDVTKNISLGRNGRTIRRRAAALLPSLPWAQT